VRPAKTQHENWLTGTVSQVGRSTTAKAPSVYEGGRPKIPSHLGKIARAEFKRVVHELEHRRTLTPGDRLTIAVLAECYERWVLTKAELGNAWTITSTFTDKKGNAVTTVKANPLVKIVEVAEARLLALQSSLGLTPLARDRVRPTQIDTSLEVIPGSLADTNPELFGGQQAPVVEFVPMAPPATIEEDETEKENSDANTGLE
jgi:P27 family predicted phage terminase small subunit